jgi:Predicted membrane protein/domain
MSINKAVGLQRDIPAVTVGVRARRIGAAIVDLLIVSCIQIWLSSVFGVVNPASGYQTDGDGVPSFFSGLASIHPAWLYVIVLLYFFVQESLFSTTIGKFFFGLYVVDMRGRRLTFLAAFIRDILRFVDAFPIFYIIGIISSVLSPTFQRLGDRTAHTTVVPMVLVPHAVHSRAAFMWRYIPLIAVVVLGVAFCVSFTYYDRPPLVIAGWANINNVLVEDANRVSQAGGQASATVPPCGALHQDSGVYVLGRQIKITTLGPAHWHDANTVTYTVKYADNVSCSATIMLYWHGFLDGGWQVASIHLYS